MRIEEDCTLARATIGPNVTLLKGSVVEDSTIRDSVLGAKVQIRKSELANSFIGDNAVVEGIRGELTIADHSEVRGR